eukprot:scaffold1503_cov120-Isochrysis_galbana.AAC.15
MSARLALGELSLETCHFGTDHRRLHAPIRRGSPGLGRGLGRSLHEGRRQPWSRRAGGGRRRRDRRGDGRLGGRDGHRWSGGGLQPRRGAGQNWRRRVSLTAQGPSGS